MPALTTLSRVAPWLASEIGWRAWRHVGPPGSVRPGDSEVLQSAVREILDVDGAAVCAYRWGNGPRLIVLVHGWRSRASRFSTIIRALEDPNVTIVSFDAPGNGDSPGRFVTILDYVACIEALVQRHGPVDTIIGHSFGVLAAFLAARESVHVNHIVGISGMYSLEQLVTKFSEEAGLTGRAMLGLRRRVERRTFSSVENVWTRFVAETDPTATDLPILLIHDTEDTMVHPTEMHLISEAHTGPVQCLVTSGLGHTRILRDPIVAGAISDFVRAQSEGGQQRATPVQGDPLWTRSISRADGT
jgi:pimeloyl-ACP methyl ester carboxylesterase